MTDVPIYDFSVDQQNLNDAYKQIEHNAIKLLSLNIFDTLLFRSCEKPTDVFLHQYQYLRAEHLIPNSLHPYEWSELRQSAEKKARQNTNCHSLEVTLHEIYHELPQALIDLNKIEQLIASEITAEQSLIYLDPYISKLIEYATEHNIVYICVSDTYYSCEQLQQIISAAYTKQNAYLPMPSRIYSSSELKENKSTHLFSLILNDLSYNPEEILHVGDNYTADIVQAQKQKINTLFYKQAADWQIEIEALEQRLHTRTHTEYNELFFHLRRKVANSLSNAQLVPSYEALGAFIYGPVFYGFGAWCVEQAKQRDIKKIFCFTRESHLLVPVLQSMVQQDDIEIHTLAISRQFAKLVAINQLTVSSLLGLFYPAKPYQGKDVLSALGLDSDNQYINAHEWLENTQMPDRLAALLADEQYQQKINLFIKNQQAQFYAYLNNIGFFSEREIAVCDLGWNGTIHKLLRTFLTQYQVTVKISGLYLATTSNALTILSDYDSLFSYLIHFGRAPFNVDAFFLSPELIELVTMPQHGAILYFHNEQPVFAAPLLNQLQLKQMDSIQNGILLFINTVSQIAPAIDSYSYRKQFNLLALLRVIILPTTTEVGLFKAWQREFGNGSNQLFALIPEQNWLIQQIINKPLSRVAEGFNMHDHWLAGVMEITGGNTLRDLFMLTQLEKIPSHSLANLILEFPNELPSPLPAPAIQPTLSSTVYDRAPFLLHSMKNFNELILHTLNSVQIKTIIIIGVETSSFLKELCHYAMENNGQVIGIAPGLPPDFITQLDEQTQQHFKLFNGTSKQFFLNYPTTDWGNTAFFIDGDHNFPTVEMELNAIHHLSRNRKNQVLILLHDTTWPCGYRDLYYIQGEACLHTEQALAPIGHGVNMDTNAPFWGANLSLIDGRFALAYGGERNGISAAVELFIATHPDYAQWKIPLMFGLTIIIPKSLPCYHELDSFMAPWTSALLARLEHNRLEMFLAIIKNDQFIADFHKVREENNILKHKLLRYQVEAAAGRVDLLSTKQDLIERQARKIQQLEIEKLELKQRKFHNTQRKLNKPLIKKLYYKIIHYFRYKLMYKRNLAVCSNSVYFDKDWYLTTYNDVKNAGVDPINHYIQYGVYEGRDPGPAFSTIDYLQKYPKLLVKGVNPLVHVEKKDLYQKWINLYDIRTRQEKKQMLDAIVVLAKKPLISIIMPVYNTPEQWLKLAIESVLNQLYPHWELCIADDASTAPHIKEVLHYYGQMDSRIKIVYRSNNGHISAASNSALQLACGEYIALFDHDDVLPIHALYKVVEEINNHPDALLIYSDEDKIDTRGKRSAPYFKSDWNPDLLYCHNFISHFGVYQRALVNRIGGFRKGYEGSQDYDLALRVVEQIHPSQIRHIPHILYHWRMIPGSTALDHEAKNYAYVAARKAIQSHLERIGVTNARVVQHPTISHFHRVIYALPVTLPLVSIIIPTKDQVNLLKQCVESLLNKTEYPNYELIIIDNQSVEQETYDYLTQLQDNQRIKIISYDMPFNYSKINNFAVNQHAKGEVITFLNNDTEVISTNWLNEMVSHVVRPEIGIVGAKLYYPNDTIQHAGVICGLGPKKGKGVAGHIHCKLTRNDNGYIGKAVLTQNFLAVTAACMMIRREVFQELGGFEESNLIIAFNDVDLCLRAYKQGYRILWTPYAELYHHESATRKLLRRKHDKKETRYMLKNWNNLLQNDPFYNPNLNLSSVDYSLAFPPRNNYG